MQTILITGGTGLVGMFLSRHLRALGYRVIHLSRRANAAAEFPAFAWDVDKQTIDNNAITQADFIIHLAGAGIADKRWTESRKAEIIRSRVGSTQLLARALRETGHRPQAFVAASATGFYGDSGTIICTEQTPTGADFLAQTCQAWENSSQEIRALGIRTPLVRIGIVLSTQGGALAKMLPSYAVRVGAYFGDGSQYYSWIHIEDLARIFEFLVANADCDGIYNGVSPTPVSNYGLARAIADARGQKALLVPAPAFAMRAAMGEMAAVVLNSNRVLPQALQDCHFDFKYTELVPALQDLLMRKL